MVYNYKEILKIYKTRKEVMNALSNKKLYRIENGIYSDSNNANELVVFSKKYPSSIITMASALYHYNLSSDLPDKVHLATARNSYIITNEKVSQSFLTKEIFYEGKTEVLIDGNYINIYDKERLLIELIRKKSKLPISYYKEVISNYRKIANELDMNKISEYLSLFKNRKTLVNILEFEVF